MKNVVIKCTYGFLRGKFIGGLSTPSEVNCYGYKLGSLDDATVMTEDEAQAWLDKTVETADELQYWIIVPVETVTVLRAVKTLE